MECSADGVSVKCESESSDIMGSQGTNTLRMILQHGSMGTSTYGIGTTNGRVDSGDAQEPTRGGSMDGVASRGQWCGQKPKGDVA